MMGVETDNNRVEGVKCKLIKVVRVSLMLSFFIGRKDP